MEPTFEQCVKINGNIRSKHFDLLNPDTIVYCEAVGSYTKVLLNNNKLLVFSLYLKRVSEKLPHKMFFRCHHSFLVNKNYIDSATLSGQTTVVLSNGVEIEVSRRKKPEMIDLIKELNSKPKPVKNKKSNKPVM